MEVSTRSASDGVPTLQASVWAKPDPVATAPGTDSDVSLW